MLTKITTKSNTLFIYDTETIVPWHNNIIRCNFISLRCYKVITDKGYSYEYPDFIFITQNLCDKESILSEAPANDVEIELFNCVKNKESLGKDLQKLLRDNYLTIIDRRTKNSQNNLLKENN